MAGPPIDHDHAEPGAAGATRFGAGLALAWLPALVGASVIPAAASLNALADGPNPYFVPEHFGLLYLASPLVMASACVLLVSPGLLLALRLGAARSLGSWLAAAVVLDCVLLAVLTQAVELVLDGPLRGRAFLFAVAALSAGLGVWVLRSGGESRANLWPPVPGRVVRLVLVVSLPALVWLALLPKFLWEVFNGDGAHAYESARLLLSQPLPFWSPEAGSIAAFPAFNSMLYAFPSSWFIRAFGELEVSARIPYLLYLGVLFATIVSLAEHGREKLRLPELGLVGAALLVYSIALGYSATYSPYSADFALPATQDTLLMVCFFGGVLALVESEIEARLVWIAVFVAATCASLPSGPMLLGLLLAGAVLFLRPVPWRALGVVVAALVGWIAFTGLAAKGLAAMGHPMAEGEYGLGALLGRFRYLQIADLRRVGFILIPCGLFPALAIAAWRWQDGLGRALIAVWGAYFGLFYIQSYVSLHHFVPAMLLPLVAVFRADALWRPRYRRATVSAAVALLGVAFWLAWPTTTIHTAMRHIGGAIDDRVGGYERLEPLAFRSAGVIAEAIPLPWQPVVPDASYGASPSALLYYASRSEARDGVAYRLRPATEPMAPGARRLGELEGVALDLVDPVLHAQHLAIRPAGPIGSPALRIPRSTLYQGVAGRPDYRVYDMRRLLRRLSGTAGGDDG